MDVPSEVLQVAGILVAVSTFITGFASVNMHGHRDRTFERLERLYEGAVLESGNGAPGEAHQEPRMVQLQEVAREIFRPPGTLPSTLANVALLGVILLIGIAGVVESGVKLDWPPEVGVWLLVSLIGAEVLVVLMMVLDHRLVQAQLVEKWKWLTRRLPWLPLRVGHLETDAVDVLVTRLTLSIAGGELTQRVNHEARKALIRRSEEAGRFLGSMLSVYDRQFIVESEDTEAIRQSVLGLEALTRWLGEIVEWLLPLLVVGRRGGLLASPPDRPEAI